MSEYQYYEFLAIDRPLDKAAQEALRSISSRARITAMSFTNHYNWGDFGGDPRKLAEQWFDLHLYLANWGTRRLMVRVPKRFLSRAEIDPFLREVDWVETWISGDNVIVDIHRDNEPDYDDEPFGFDEEPSDYHGDGPGWLGALAPLRADLLSGDLRLFYLLWLTAVQDKAVAAEDVEPLPGIGPLTAALEAFAAFFSIDRDLVEAAAESGEGDLTIGKDSMRQALAAIAETEKTAHLLRVVEGDGHVAAELKRRMSSGRQAPAVPRRTVAALRMRAREIGAAKERAEVERQEAERRRRAEEEEEARQARIEMLKRRGASVWREIEEEVERRNASGYDKAASLLSDLQALAVEEGREDEFARRLASIRTLHEKKAKFIERIAKLG